MRIPVSKIYRAFPELDKFSDEVCEQYVLRARNRRMGSGCVTAVLAVAAAVVSCIAMSGCLGFVVAPLAQSLGLRIGDPYQNAVIVLAAIAVPVCAIMVGFVIRDAWLRWAIRGCIDAARCGKCDYSLLGLPAERGIVTCPECGTPFDLTHAGLTAEDVLAKTPQP